MIHTRSHRALRPRRFAVAIRWIGLSLMASTCLFPFYAMIVLSLKSGTVELPGSLCTPGRTYPDGFSTP